MAKRNKLDRYYDEDDEYNRDKIIPDGGSVSVPLELMDGNTRRGIAAIDARYVANDHRPHFAQPTELETFRRQTARQVMIDRATSGWMGRDQKPEAYEPEPAPDDDDDVDDQTRRTRARDVWLRNMKNAWRTAPPTPTGFAGSVGPNNAGPQISNRVGAGDGSRPLRSVRDAQGAKDAAYAEYVQRTANAWRAR